MTRLEQQLNFIRELDRLKTVQRQTWRLDASRKENSAEHAWHIAVMAMVLAEYAPQKGIEVSRAVQMLLVHDIVDLLDKAVARGALQPGADTPVPPA